MLTHFNQLTRSSLVGLTLAFPLMPVFVGRGPSWKMSRMNSFSCSCEVIPGPMTVHMAEY